MNLDAANYTSGTWDDTITSNSATVTDALFDKELGNFFTFDGATSAGDRIEFPHDATLNQGADISWEVWVKRDDTGIGTILHKGTASSGTFQYFFYYNSAYGYLWYSYAQGGGIYSGNAATTVGVWEHVVFTNDSSGNGKMYVNGELTTSSTLGARGAPTASVTNTNVLNIGGYDALNGNNGHDGEIGVVRFYDTALSAAQVAQNYLATKNDYPNGNHATNNGAIFTYSSTPYYFNFDGSNDYFSTNLIKNWASVHWSVEVWFNTDVRADDYLWGMTDSSGYGVSVSLRSSNNSYNIFLIGVGNISAGVYNSGQWYQLVYTSDGTTRKAYLNGSFVNSGTAGIDSRANGKPFTIGRYGNYSGGYYDGKVGLVRVFDKELTASEVTANYDADKATYGLS